MSPSETGVAELGLRARALSHRKLAGDPGCLPAWPALGVALLEPTPAPCDVLSVSSSLHRVLDGDPAPGLPAHQHLPRSHTAPAGLAAAHQPPGARGRRRAVCQVVWLVFLFVALDVSKNLAVSWAAVGGHLCAPVVISAKNLLSISCGMALAFRLDGAAGVLQCLHLRRALQVLPLAASFCAAQVLSLRALRSFDPGSLKIGAQLNLPLTALLSRLVLGQRYSAGQWLAIWLLLVATMAFLQVRMLFFEPPHHSSDLDWSQQPPHKVLGAMCFLAAIGLSCFASILAERFLKKGNQDPFYVQKTNLMLGEFLTACCMVHFQFGAERAGSESCSWEQVWDWWQLPVILAWFTHGWIASLLVKKCSSLVKNVSHILSAVVTYFLPVALGLATAHRWPVTLSAFLVLIAVLVFGTAPRAKREEPQSSVAAVAPAPRPSLAASKSAAEVALEPKGGALAPAAAQLAPAMSAQAPVAGGLRVASAPCAPRPSEVPRARSGLSCGTISVGLLAVCFILLDALKPMLVTWAQQGKLPRERFHSGAFILVQTSLSLVVGLAIAVRPQVSPEWPPRVRLHPEWRGRLRRCLDLRQVARQLPVAGCLCLSKAFLMTALGRLDAGTVRVFGQASLPLVGVASTLFMKKRYSAQQWCSLVAISTALVAFYHVKAEVKRVIEDGGQDAPSGRGIEVIGVLLILLSIGFNSLGALYLERFLQGGQARLHQQKCQLLLGEVAVNALLLLALPLVGDASANSPWRRGLFVGWDMRVLVCVLVWIPAGWTATMLVKRCSNLSKTVAQGTSGVLTYIFSVVPLSRGPRFWTMFVQLLGEPLNPEPFSWPVVLLAITVMLAALTFGAGSAGRGARSAKAAPPVKATRPPRVVNVTSVPLVGASAPIRRVPLLGT